ncbi:cell shape-determining protein MreC [Luteitalea sp. TBR-22]|uniref:rod shape-determining protein MreC n=1 Tax=Luteitalea sp. TBR-22 TaxID=2802971 RepID=UPI001AF0C5DE|nr:rod shape-determining protein MreC [Luteitalea sp. TBR-22]BCS34501.1 cell shape-determining protein MreC [Luteitalea sp. TBR-22]
MLTNDRGPVLEFQKRTGYLLVAALLGHLLLISAQVSSQTGASVLETTMFGALSRVQALTSWVTQGITGAWGNYVALRGHRARADALQLQLDRLGVQLQHATAQARRTEQLERLLQLQRTELPATMAARVIAADPAAAFRTVTIDKGASDGVRRDMAVLSPLGVVGRVIDEPAAHAAKVQLIIDRNAGAGGVIERNGAGGVVVGASADTDLPLRMEYVSNLADVTPGDLVMTSGLDGIYPRGFVLGRVERAERGSGLYRLIAIRPSVDFSSLDTVLLVTGPQPARPDAGTAPASNAPGAGAREGRGEASGGASPTVAPPQTQAAPVGPAGTVGAPSVPATPAGPVP